MEAFEKRGVSMEMGGVLPEYWGKGIDALLHKKIILKERKVWYNSSKMGWRPKSDKNMIHIAEKLGGVC